MCKGGEKSFVFTPSNVVIKVTKHLCKLPNSYLHFSSIKTQLALMIGRKGSVSQRRGIVFSGIGFIEGWSSPGIWMNSSMTRFHDLVLFFNWFYRRMKLFSNIWPSRPSASPTSLSNQSWKDPLRVVRATQSLPNFHYNLKTPTVWISLCTHCKCSKETKRTLPNTKFFKNICQIYWKFVVPLNRACLPWLWVTLLGKYGQLNCLLKAKLFPANRTED